MNLYRRLHPASPARPDCHHEHRQVKAEETYRVDRIVCVCMRDMIGESIIIIETSSMSGIHATAECCSSS